jgi:hypothetical protein
VLTVFGISYKKQLTIEHMVIDSEGLRNLTQADQGVLEGAENPNFHPPASPCMPATLYLKNYPPSLKQF